MAEFRSYGRPEDEPYYSDRDLDLRSAADESPQSREDGRARVPIPGRSWRLSAHHRRQSNSGRNHRSDAGMPGAETIPSTCEFWRLAVFQAVQAIRHPGQEFTAKAVAFQYDLKTGFLEVMLPSGRQLTYPKAELFEDEQHDSVSFTFLDASGSKAGRMYHERRGQRRISADLLLENITQALCRDIFAEAMPRLEAAGYPIVMHTHDEYVCEVPEDFGSLDEFLASSPCRRAGRRSYRSPPRHGSPIVSSRS